MNYDEAKHIIKDVARRKTINFKILEGHVGTPWALQSHHVLESMIAVIWPLLLKWLLSFVYGFLNVLIVFITCYA